MKALITIITLTMIATNAMAAVECEKVDGERGYRPKNELAKKIALSLNVKTCNGARFKAVVKGLGETSNVPATAKVSSVDDVIKSLKK